VLVSGSAVIAEVFGEAGLPYEEPAACSTSATFRGVGYVHCELDKKKSLMVGEMVTPEGVEPFVLNVEPLVTSDMVIKPTSRQRGEKVFHLNDG
jgi:hypothetical protein